MISYINIFSDFRKTSSLILNKLSNLKCDFKKFKWAINFS